MKPLPAPRFKPAYHPQKRYRNPLFCDKCANTIRHSPLMVNSRWNLPSWLKIYVSVYVFHVFGSIALWRIGFHIAAEQALTCQPTVSFITEGEWEKHLWEITGARLEESMRIDRWLPYYERERGWGLTRYVLLYL